MAFELIPLWDDSLHKEALDLMIAVWPSLTPHDRERLVVRIAAGPPVLNDDQEAERLHRWSDRRVFERLVLIERISDPPLPRSGQVKLSALRSAYPEWELDAGDRAHFTFLIDSSYGPITDRSPADFVDLELERTITDLRTEEPTRDGRLAAWKQVVEAHPQRGMDLLRRASLQPESGDGAIWSDTLMGLREAMLRPETAKDVIELLLDAPAEIASSPELIRSVGDVLEEMAKRQEFAVPEDGFLRLWECFVDRCIEQGPEEPPQGDDWVGRALNRPLGRLVTALLNVMFRRGLKVGSGLPTPFREHLDRFGTAKPELRTARVILASRLSYLHAVDSEWARSMLLPGFDWERDEDEATALWHGYAWGARIDVELWTELAPYLYDAFTPGHLARLGDTSRTLAGLLMAAGVEFPAAIVSDDRSRRAVRAMSVDDRRSAVSWLHSHVAGPGDDGENDFRNTGQVEKSDRLWEARVHPWLKRIWPKDRALVDEASSTQFALLAIATVTCFSHAVDFLLPMMKGVEYPGQVIGNLLQSSHPENHPETTILLLDKLLLNKTPWSRGDLKTVLERLEMASPGVRQDPMFRRLDSLARVAGP